MFVSGEWFYPSPYGQTGHTFFHVLPPFSLMDQGCWLGWHQGFCPLPELCLVIQLLRGSIREEFLLVPPVWSICQRKATQGCWCDWAGWEHSCWAGLSQKCGNCCFHILLCLIYIIIDKRRCLIMCSLIRQGLLIEETVNRGGFFQECSCIPFYIQNIFLGQGMWTMAIYIGKPDPTRDWVSHSIANSLWFS